MVRLMTHQIDRLEGTARVEKLKTDFQDRVGRARNILETDDQLRQLAALEKEFDTALDRGDLSVAQTKDEAVGDLVFKVLVQTPEFWKYQLSALFQKFTDLNMVNVAQKQFAEGAEAMERENGMQDLIRICLELLALLPREERSQFDAVVSNVMGGGSR